MRFDQPAYTPDHFTHEVWVRCPKCGQRGQVITQRDPETKRQLPATARFVCTQCPHTLSAPKKWEGYVYEYTAAPCHHCGNPIQYCGEPTRKPAAQKRLTCGVCGTEALVPLQSREHLGRFAQDPRFGLALWLQIIVHGETLWLYNLEHLAYLRAYVAASVREAPDRHKYSIITNLPQFVKAAKHRDVIVRKLDALAAQYR